MWFGEPWPSPDDRALVCLDDAQRVETPVGRACLFCTYEIGPGDQGVFVPALTDGPGWPEPTTEPVHISCVVRT